MAYTEYRGYGIEVSPENDVTIYTDSTEEVDLLAQKLIEIARNRGLEVMEGQVLANNYRMLELMMSLNFQVGNDPDDPGIKLVVTRLN